MRAAVLVGVHEYVTPELGNLPACKSDVEFMRQLLEASGRYENILALTEATTAIHVKSEISNWIKVLQEQQNPIEEVFFYYSGHGTFTENEFYFLLADFEEAKRSQTSMANSEVDRWLRSLNPLLAVKVVDACRSGIQYIKDSHQTLETHLNKSTSSFQSCYFMFSSRLDQPSFQDSELSYFTRSFLSAIHSFTGETIRYKDIVDYISDEFRNSPDQRPFFVAQADFTEEFFQITPELKTAIQWADQQAEAEVVEFSSSPLKAVSLKEIIEKDAQKYFSEEAVIQFLNEIRLRMEAFKHSAEFLDLYETRISFYHHYDNLPNPEVIGRWLAENSDKFFAEATFKKEPYKPEPFEMPGFYPEYIEVVTDFRITASNLPYHQMSIQAIPRYLNLRKHICYGAFLLSKTHIRFFYCYTKYQETDWRADKIIKGIKWKTVEHPLTSQSAIFQSAENIPAEFEALILEEVRATFSDDSGT